MLKIYEQKRLIKNGSYDKVQTVMNKLNYSKETIENTVISNSFELNVDKRNLLCGKFFNGINEVFYEPNSILEEHSKRRTDLTSSNNSYFYENKRENAIPKQSATIPHIWRHHVIDIVPKPLKETHTTKLNVLDQTIGIPILGSLSSNLNKLTMSSITEMISVQPKNNPESTQSKGEFEALNFLTKKSSQYGNYQNISGILQVSQKLE